MTFRQIRVLAALAQNDEVDVFLLIFKFIDTIHQQARAMRKLHVVGNARFREKFFDIVADDFRLAVFNFFQLRGKPEIGLRAERAPEVGNQRRFVLPKLGDIKDRDGNV